MYTSIPSFVLGFHGCTKSIGERALTHKLVHLKSSENQYDWLGHGEVATESFTNPCGRILKAKKSFDHNLKNTLRSFENVARDRRSSGIPCPIPKE